MNKQIFLGFAIIAAAAMMMTSQMPEAYAADFICNNQTIDSSTVIKKKTNIIVEEDPTGFNLCVINGIVLKQGNIFVGANAAVFITGGADIKGGDIVLEGQFSAVNFEPGPTQNVMDGNIFGVDDTYIFLNNVRLEGNVVTSGEVYFSNQPSRFTGPTQVVGNISIQLSGNDNEFVLAGDGDDTTVEVTGNVKVFTSLSVHVFDITIGGNLELLDNVEDTSFSPGFILIENNDIGSNLKLQRNTMPSVLLIGNTVGGSLNIQDNPSDIELDGNTIGANASCKGNGSVSGSGNDFQGKGKKQCEQLFA